MKSSKSKTRRLREVEETVIERMYSCNDQLIEVNWEKQCRNNAVDPLSNHSEA